MSRPRLALALLTLVYVVNFVDRQLIGILGQPIKAELGLSDTQLGLLGGAAFALFYTLLQLPIARLAERRARIGIVAASLALWSAMTALCGLAGSATHLTLARIGVGIGEAGCAPPSQSLVADLYPPERRATALSLLSMGIPLGMLTGAVAGGWIAQTLGWRTAFVALGLPGLVLALVLWRVVPEPSRGPAVRTPSLAEVFRILRGRPAFLHMAAGASLASFAGYGLTSFAVPLVIRRFDLPLATAASGYGLIAGLGIGIGVGSGGWLSDRLSRGRAAAPGLVAAGGVLVAAILFQLAIGQATPTALALAAIIPLIGAHLYFGPTYGVTANSVDARSRATAVAILLMAMNAIGLGLGPLAVGALSDHFLPLACRAAPAACPRESAAALTKALRIDLLVYLWAAAHFLFAARALRDQPHSSAR